MEDVLRTIKPTSEETARLAAKVNAFLKKIGKAALVGGSYAKGTWLAGNYDIDIFVPYPLHAKNISQQLEKLLKKRFKHVTLVHGSRDYYQIREKDILFEVIPIKEITTAADAENITDVSPLHVQWVNTHSNAYLKDQIRLAKQFCKAHHIYGAETYIKGFSGYVLEILTIYYGNFAKLLKHALHWKDNMIIDVAGHYQDINASKKSSLMVIDPVQPTRNAAAALSAENIQRFKAAARLFLQHPAPEAFIEKHTTLTDLQKKDLLIKATPRKGKRDTVGTKLLKAFETITRKLTEEGYEIQDKGWEWDTHAYYWYTIKKKKLDAYKKHYGPPLAKKQNVIAFKKKHARMKMGVEKNRCYVLIPRKYKTLTAYARSIIKEKEIRQRVQRITLL